MQLNLALDDPRTPEVREARLAAQRAEYAADEHAQQLRRKRHARASERHSANHRRWYVENRAERIEANRRWRAENPEKARAHARLRNFRKRGGMDAEAIEYAAIVLADPCVYCGGIAEHVDHIEPLAHGGAGEWMNLAGACASCNGAKRDTPLLRFLLRRNQPHRKEALPWHSQQLTR